MKTREQLKGEVEDIREELQYKCCRPRMRRLVRNLEIKRRTIRYHEIMMGLGLMLMLAICLVGCEPPAELSSPAAAETIEANVSAYCPCERCCGKYSDGITANGYKIQPGDKFCAADARYPFGTMLDIPGYGKVPVLDRGGAIKGNKLDVYFPTHEQALQWGRQYLTVSIERKEQ